VTGPVPPVLVISGTRVAVVKPAQTAEPPGPTGDPATIRRLS